MTHENICIVDEKDKLLGKGTKAEALKKGLIYRATHVFIFNSKKELLMQLRKADKDLYPSFWECSASGTVEYGETYEENAYKELEEEVGITGVELIYIGKLYWETEHNKEFSKFYVGHYNGPIVIQESEIEDYKWVSLDNVFEMKITPGVEKGIMLYKQQEI